MDSNLIWCRRLKRRHIAACKLKPCLNLLLGLVVEHDMALACFREGWDKRMAICLVLWHLKGLESQHRIINCPCGIKRLVIYTQTHYKQTCQW